jgi:hypothetical protein
LVDDESDPSLFQSKFAFRLLYNGQVLTDQVQGCSKDSDLCDAKHLTDRVQPFAVRDVDCVDPDAGKVDGLKVAKSLMTTTGGVILALMVVAASALMGSIGVFYYLTGTIPTEELNILKNRMTSPSKKKKSYDMDEDDSIASSGRRSTLVADSLEMTMSDADASYDEAQE